MKENNKMYKYKDFIYTANGIVVPEKIIEPKRLFKYYGCENYHYESFMKAYLYASHPYNFNDSIDGSSLLLNFKNIDKEKYNKLWNEVRWEGEENNPDNYYADNLKGFEHIRQRYYIFKTKRIGLVSLTSSPLNILMWAHYSSEKGFAIELDTQKLKDNIKNLNEDIERFSLKPIQYVKKLEAIDVSAKDFYQTDIPLSYISNIKRDVWKYENEWRLRIYKEAMKVPISNFFPTLKNIEGSNRFTYYPKEAIKAVFLGKYFANGNNCEAIYDKEIKLKNSCENKLFIKFINYLSEYFNDRLYLSGELESNSTFGRTLGKIELRKIDDLTFEIIDLKEKYKQIK
ncbi:PF11185 family protein [Capnocytophaga sp. oral taxon 412 str. F0487]|uniref:DUF2971 domain-containing protein n=1 Tax=Capnocytophaga sp. oral taxon 412 TaxID=712218 RepID=UPI0002696633|nr:DUF2971 domain-containing protein [Capnocytophaga sp. oral taxon 412]EIW91134.1 PF11185 family protein [Capnocytophaga sp. oral taxon 412 str. F0487]